MLGRGDDGGQGSVELALVLPFVALLALLLVQVGLVVRAQILVTHAAREGARSAAVETDPSRVRQAVAASSALSADRFTVSVSPHPADERVTVTVRYSAPTDVPFVGVLLGDVVVESSTTMRVESGEDG